MKRVFSIVFFLIFNSSLIFSQLTITTKGFSKIVDCGNPDTVVATIRNTGGTIATISNVTITFQTNMELIGTSLNCTQSGGTATAPILNFTPSTIAPGATDSLKFTVKALCGYTSSAGASTSIAIQVNSNALGSPHSANFSGYTAIEPNLVFSEQMISDPSPAARVDQVVRVWKIVQSNSGAYVTTAYLQNDYSGLRLDSVKFGGDGVSYSTLPVARYTNNGSKLFLNLDTSIIKNIGNNDNVFETSDDTLYIKTWFRSTGCSITSSYQTGYACANATDKTQFCSPNNTQSTVITPIGQSGSIDLFHKNISEINTCSGREYSFTIKNSSPSEIKPGSAAIFDICFNMYYFMNFTAFYINIDSVVVDDFTIHNPMLNMRNYLGASSRLVLGDFITAPSAGSLLQDLDGDGAYDDLAIGDSINITFHFSKLRDLTTSDPFSQAVHYLTYHTRSCSPNTGFSSGISSKRHRLTGGFVMSSTLEPVGNIYIGDTINQRVFRSSFRGNISTNCDSNIFYIEVELAKGIKLDSSLNAHRLGNLRGVPAFGTSHQVDSITWIVAYRLGDFFSVNPNLRPGDYIASNSYVDFKIIPTCDFFEKNDICDALSGFRVLIKNGWMECYKACGGIDTDSVGRSSAYVAGSQPIQVLDTAGVCSFTANSITMESFNAYRTTFGYTNKWYTTPAAPNNLKTWKSGDSVEIVAHAMVRGGVHDSVQLKLDFISVNQKHVFDWVNAEIRVYDSSSGTYYTYNNLMEHGLIVGTVLNQYFSFDVVSLGLAGNQLTEGDSIWMKINGVVQSGPTQDPNLPLLSAVSSLSRINAYLLYKTIGNPYQECNYKQVNGIRMRILNNVTRVYFDRGSGDCNSTLDIGSEAYAFNWGTQNDHKPILYYDSIILHDLDPAYFIVDTTRPVIVNYAGTPIYIPASDVTWTTNGVKIYNTSNLIPPLSSKFGYQSTSVHSGAIRFQVPVYKGCRLGNGSLPYNYLRTELAKVYGDFFPVNHHLRTKDTSSHMFRPGNISLAARERYTITPIISAVTLDSIVSKFVLNINNLSVDASNTPTQGSKHTFIYINDANDVLKISMVRQQGTTITYPVVILPDGSKYIQLDSLAASEVRTLEVFFTMDTCASMQFEFSPSFSCGAYPPNEFFQSCPSLASQTFFVNTQNATVITSILSQPSGLQNLCDTLDFELEIVNTNLGVADSLNLTYYLPVSQRARVVSSVAIIDGDTLAITGILNDSIYTFDLKNQVLDSTLNQVFQSDDTIKILIGITTICGAATNEYHAFSVDGRQVCGDYIPQSTVATSNQIAIDGLAPTYAATLTGSGGVLNQCSYPNYAITIKNIGGAASNDTTRLQDTLVLNLPLGFSYVDSSYIGIHNSLPNGEPVVIDTVAGITSLRFGLPSGVVDGDSIVFSMGLTTPQDTCNSVHQFDFSVLQYFEVYCGLDLCPTGTSIGSGVDSVTLVRANLALTTMINTLNACNDTLITSFELINNGYNIDSGFITTVYFAADTNNNGILDSTDVLILGSEFIYTDSIANGDTLFIIHQFLASTFPKEICNLIAFIDTSSCTCDTNYAIAPIALIDFELDSLSLCENDSVLLGACAGTGFYLTRVYSWTDASGMGAQQYLSDTTILNPTFTPPNLNINKEYQFVLTTERESCNNTDTVVISVNATPDAFTLTDTLVCPNTLYQIIPDIAQAGVVYSVWDSLTGGTNLGNTPFGVFINNDSSFFIEATDTTGGCTLSPRVEIKLFKDSIAPIISCNDTTIYLNTSGQFTIDTSFVFTNATDNCGVDSVWINDTLFTCADIGLNTVTIYAIDVNGNRDSCTSSVTVLDTLKPIITTIDTVIYVNGLGQILIDTSYTYASSSDNCGIDSIWTNDTSYNCVDVGVNISTMYVLDINGNIDSTTSNITVLDTINPIVICNDTIIYLNVTGTYTIDTSHVFANASDNCGIDSVWIITNTFTCSEIGINTITVYARDVNNNVDSCMANVTVLDTINPTITCKDTTIYLNTLGTYSIDTSYVFANASDNCGVDSVWISTTNYICINTGLNSVRLYVRDNNNNLDSCTATVTVLDTLNPVVTCKDTTVYLNTLGTYTIDTSYVFVNASDNCGVDSIWITTNTFNCTNTGLNTVTVYVRDNNNNIDSCIANVTVLDTLNPIVTCKDTTIYLNALGTYTIDTSYVFANASDNCGIDSIWITPTNYTCADTGVNTVTVYTRDVNNNVDSCIANVTVLDTINPITLCKDTVVYLDGTGSYVIDSSYINNGSYDACGIQTITLSKTIFTCLDTGINTVTLYVRDNNNNVDSCIATVTVLDTLNPVVTCKDTTVYLNTLGTYTIDTSYVFVNASDNCGVDSVWITTNTFNCTDTGLNTVTVYVRDNNNNLDSCIANVTVLDTLTPLVTCKDTTVYLNALGTYTIDTSYVFVNANDNCGVDSIWITTSTFNCTNTGVNTVTVYARDNNNNVDSCIANITVLDTLNPIVNCQDTTVYLNALGTYTIDTSYVFVNASDNCGIDSIWITTNTFNCLDTGTNTVTVYVRDNNNNLDSCIANVTVLDTINPIITCKDTTIYLNATGTYTIDTSYVFVNASDNCGVDSIWITTNTFNCTNTGVNTVTVYARDNNNNVDSCIANVTVMDTINPIVNCQDTTVYLTALGTYTIDTSYVFENASDNCGVDSVWITTNTFTCADTGLNTVTVYVRDNNNNLDSCIANVTVLDTIPPTVICNDTTIYLGINGQYTIDTSYIFTSANDNCSIDSIWTTDTLYTCGDIGTIQATIYVRDASGNIDSCVANVTVMDTIAPTVTCKDTTIYLNASGTYTIDTSYVFVKASDNCGIDSVWITNTSFTCADTGLNMVTIYARDVNNNLDSCISNVTVLDTVNPTISCQNATVYLDTNGQFIIDTSYVYSSAFAGCGLDSVWIVDSVFDCSRIGVNTVSVYARDINGNVDSCQAQVTVMDTVTPQITCGSTLYDTVSNSCEYIVPDFRTSTLPADNCTDSINFQITQVPTPGTVITVQDQQIETITITVTDTNGNPTVCMFDVELTCSDEFQIPEFISPNGDGKNDTWIITGIEAYPNNNVKIFNRYGAMVYQTNGYHNQWDGTANVDYIFQTGESDQILPSGTYFFILELDADDSNSEMYDGFIYIRK